MLFQGICDYSSAVWLGTRIKWNIFAGHAMNAAIRILGIPDLRYYALADGIKAIFNCIGKGPSLPRISNQRLPFSFTFGEKMGERLSFFLA